MRRRGGSWRRNWGRRFRERKGGLECDGMVYKGWKEGRKWIWIWICIWMDMGRLHGKGL